ncbi:unnamed protein product [Polarella glacialis]|uniref:Pentatricopeptide repeat-containing protein, chloroplastic n=1 Tax=Polarella glacialis TaxID=89957 RepID=A0A813M236_POLGL|nr:unnamed protein product [Polarella glacialis]
MLACGQVAPSRRFGTRAVACPAWPSRSTSGGAGVRAASEVLEELARAGGGDLGAELDRWRQSPKLATRVFSALTKQRRTELAGEVLSFMWEGRVQVDAFHCSAAISACAKGSQWQLALDLLASRMPEMSVAPVAVSYTAAIAACSNGRQWQLALGLMSSMPQESIAPDGVSFTAAMSACEKGGQWQLALGLLGQMPAVRLRPTETNFNAAIDACSKAGEWQQALGLLGKMSEFNLLPNDISYFDAVSVNSYLCVACFVGR